MNNIQNSTARVRSGSYLLTGSPTRWLRNGKTLLPVIHAIIVQRAEEQKQKNSSAAAFKDFKKKARSCDLWNSSLGHTLTRVMEK
jgi:hypothetical protein